MADRRVDRVDRRLRAMGGKARFQELLEKIRAEEGNPDLSYQTVYIAIQLENQRLDQLGERTRFVTSREGEDRGLVRLREESEFQKDSPAWNLEVRIREANERVSDDIRKWPEQMDWRTFETTFLKSRFSKPSVSGTSSPRKQPATAGWMHV
jgi:hypothetical protein